MKIVFCCRWHRDHVAAFIDEQRQSLESLGHEVRYVCAHSGGMRGYTQLYKALCTCVRDWQPDVIHAHYGICGLIANMQRKVPVITTYPGSDINDAGVRILSCIAIKLSRYNLFMGKRQMTKVCRLLTAGNSQILRYGIMIDNFVEMDKQEARQRMHFGKDERLVLFSSKFSRLGKNAPLAMEACRLANAKLLELTGHYTKEEMCCLMNAVDVAIVTSFQEGSPQFTKEALACGLPIVSVDVGDVAEQIDGLHGCYIAKTREPQELANLLQQALAFGGRTNGRQRIIELGLTNELVAQRLMEIYANINRK